MLREADRIEVRCDDEGRGPGGTAGVGTRSIRERADELGGWAEVAGLAPGTRVRVVLPVVPGTPVPRPDGAVVTS